MFFLRLKRIFFFFFLYIGSISYAQSLPNTVKGIFKENIVPLWPWALAGVFMICFLLNSGYFFGESRDIKTGIIRMLTYVLIAILATSMVGFLLTLKVRA